MGWNSPKDKSLKSSDSKQIAFGAPISANPGLVHKPYRDSWDIERAYREGMSKITWVNRCIDAIAGNQARLPVILRKDNSNKGEIIVGKEANRSTLLELLNTRANVEKIVLFLDTGFLHSFFLVRAEHLLRKYAEETAE